MNEEQAKLADLGHCVARIKNNKRTLEIIAPSFSEDGAFNPAESVSIYSEIAIKRLQKLLNETFPINNENESSNFCVPEGKEGVPVKDVEIQFAIKKFSEPEYSNDYHVKYLVFLVQNLYEQMRKF
jgi:hypothetical protein